MHLNVLIKSKNLGDQKFTGAYYRQKDGKIYLESKTSANDVLLDLLQSNNEYVTVYDGSGGLWAFAWEYAEEKARADELLEIQKQARERMEAKKAEEELAARIEAETKQHAARIEAETKQQLKEALSPSLESLDLESVDRKFKTLSSFEPTLLIELKSERLLRFLAKRINPILRNDKEKVLALAQTTCNKLVKARAGSGKTTLLGAQVILLAEAYHVKPSEMLVLAFNRAASQQIGQRIREQYSFKGFHQVRTFHSLAYNIVRPEEELLFDEDRSFYGEKHKNFIADTVRSIWSKRFKSKLMTFFHKELQEIKEHGDDLQSDEYLMFRRNMRDVTLGGDFVKSFGEKVIADYLFEHGVRYRYEDRVFVKGEAKKELGSFYKPDFTIYHNQRRIRLEHWGINEKDPHKKVAPDWVGTWDDYHSQMKWKRRFWKERQEILLETSIADFRNGRLKFEEHLHQLLDRVGIQLTKLSDDELASRVIPIHRDRMTSRFAQFIQRAKKQHLFPIEIRKLVNSHKHQDARTSIFLDLACEVYEAYEHRKNGDSPKAKQYIDFDDLLIRAAEKICMENGDCLVNLAGQGKGVPVSLNDLRYLLIDEYQDYSELFHSIISAMRKFNPGLTVMAVGDDWQSINSFSG